MIATFRTYQLPWEMAQEQDDRFRKLVRQVLIATVAFSIIVPLLPVTKRDPYQFNEPPPRFARLLIEKPVAPVERPVVIETPPPVANELEPVQQEQEPAAVQKPVVASVQPQPQSPPALAQNPSQAQSQAQARHNASRAGVLTFANQLAALRDTAVVENVVGDANLNISTNEGSGQRAERSVITSRAGTGSGGISTSTMSRNTGGGGLAGRGTTQIGSPDGVVGGSGSGSGGGLGSGTVGAGPQVVKGGSGPSRSREEIELVFDQNKGAIFALYNRALRRDSSLQGKVVLELTIDPSGAVTACRIVSSSLNDPELEQKLIQRVQMFRFEAKKVATITTTKPIDFFPA